MEFKDYYKILGVDENADTKAIKTAYRKLARKYHPDVSEEKDAEKKFKEVSEAYEVLHDANKRAEYDEMKKYQAAGGGFRPPPDWQPRGDSFGGGHYESDFSDFFDALFGSHRTGGAGAHAYSGFQNRGRDIEMELPVFLEATLADASQKIAYHLPHYDNNGRRLEDVKKTLNVKIPKGVGDGERIRLKGQGAPGIGDGPNGDLYLCVRLVPHPLFDVEGHNLIITLPLLPWEAALGTKVTVPTLEGKIQLTIAPNSQSGQRLRIKGKGLPRKDGRGDMYAVLNVVMPKTVDEKTKAAWQTLADNNTYDPRAQWSQS